VEKAVVNIANRARPEIIGICSTGVTETKGDDVDGFIRLIRARHPELDHVAMVSVSTPDFTGAFQDGWSKTVDRMVEAFVEPPAEGVLRTRKINVLPGCHLTPGDLEELRDVIEAFGLEPHFLPDLSGSLDGHIPDEFTPTTLGGIGLVEIRAMGSALATVAIGEQMRGAAITLEHKTGVPYVVFDRLTGLAPNDDLMAHLSRMSGMPVPSKYRRQRSQLVDAMLDGHFFFGGKKIAIGAEPDLLWSMASCLTEMGSHVTAAVTTTASPVLERLPVDEVLIGDLEDLEDRAATADLLVTHSHGRQAAERLKIPFYRLGLPTFDRLGAAHLVTVGYRGTRDLIFSIGNLFMGDAHEPDPDTWRYCAPQPEQLVQLNGGV
jgi:nitrogenase molybdenum-iron protein NifN